MKKLLSYGILVSLWVGFSSCGVLIGNVKPVDQKSESYGVADLSKENPAEWMKLDATTLAGQDAKDPDAKTTEVADVSYQSKKTAATISINSACRPGWDREDQDLRTTSNLLFIGISEITLREEKPAAIQDTPALETTVRGKMNGEPVMLRTIVFRRRDCIYDLVYLAPPAAFQTNLQDFAHFVASLRLK